MLAGVSLETLAELPLSGFYWLRKIAQPNVIIVARPAASISANIKVMLSLLVRKSCFSNQFDDYCKYIVYKCQ
jgi:hypothetical protein